MATIVTRAGKGSALTFTEVDNNFTNLNADGTSNASAISNLQNDKLDKAGGIVTGPLTVNDNLIAGGKVLGSSSNNSQSGATVTLTAPSTEIVRLTNVLLTSISGITAGLSGQKLVLVNRTGTTVTIENESPSATAATAQIFTGSGAPLLLNDKASISLTYDITSQRWNIIGGTGSGTGSAGINYISNPDASIGTTGYAAYNESDAVTFQDAGDTVTLNNHGLQNGQLVLFTSIVSTTGISTNTGYFVVGATTNTFQVATSSGGSALPLTTNGSGVMVRNTPKVGIGGTPPSGLFVRSTTSPLRGSGDFNFVKTGSTPYMGSGVEYDFTIDRADLAKVLTVTFDYEVVSGTLATGDLTVYIIQDPAGTPVVIQPAGYQVQAATVGTSMKHIATFQTASNVTSYRLCIHVASASALDYTVALDSISVGPQVVQYGAPVTDWVSYTPVITHLSGGITNYTISGRYRRVGDSIEAQAYVQFTGTSAAFNALTISIPPGLTLDQSKNISNVVGQGTVLDSGLAYYPFEIVIASATTVNAQIYNSAGTYAQDAQITNAIPFTFGLNDSISLSFKMPILGWSSTVQMSNDTDTRVVAFYRNNSGASTTTVGTTATKITTLNNGVTDTHSGWDSTNNRYVVPVSGYYKISGAINAGAVTTTNIRIILAVGIDGGLVAHDIASVNNPSASTQVLTCNGYITRSLNAGQTVELQARVDSGTTPAGAFTTTFLSLERLSGPSAIAASETVAMRANKTTGNHTSGVSGWQTTAAYNATPYDTHGAFNVTTGEYTVPVSGSYLVSASMGFAFNLTGVRGVRVDLDGTLAIGGNYIRTNTEQATVSVVSGILRATAGQKITLVSYQNSGGNLAYETAGYNNFSILRVGN